VGDLELNLWTRVTTRDIIETGRWRDPPVHEVQAEIRRQPVSITPSRPSWRSQAVHLVASLFVFAGVFSALQFEDWRGVTASLLVAAAAVTFGPVLARRVR
jgi:hypothetical protein